MKVKVYIEQTKYINKPDEVEVKKLNWRKEKYIQGVKENKKQVYSQNLELLAKNISEGKTFCISPNGITTELLVLDIDNKIGEKQLKLKTFFNKCKNLDIVPTILYETFSSQKHKEKTGYERYRVVWILDKELNRKEYKKAIKVMSILLDLDIDPVSINITQLMYGTNSKVYTFKATKLNLSHLVRKYNIKLPKDQRNAVKTILEPKNNLKKSSIEILIQNHKTFKEILSIPLGYTDSLNMMKAFNYYDFDIIPYLTTFELGESETVQGRIKALYRAKEKFDKNSKPQNGSLGMKLFNILGAKKLDGEIV